MLIINFAILFLQNIQTSDDKLKKIKNKNIYIIKKFNTFKKYSPKKQNKLCDVIDFKNNCKGDRNMTNTKKQSSDSENEKLKNKTSEQTDLDQNKINLNECPDNLDLNSIIYEMINSDNVNLPAEYDFKDIDLMSFIDENINFNDEDKKIQSLSTGKKRKKIAESIFKNDKIKEKKVYKYGIISKHGKNQLMLHMVSEIYYKYCIDILDYDNNFDIFYSKGINIKKGMFFDCNGYSIFNTRSKKFENITIYDIYDRSKNISVNDKILIHVVKLISPYMKKFVKYNSNIILFENHKLSRKSIYDSVNRINKFTNVTNYRNYKLKEMQSVMILFLQVLEKFINKISKDDFLKELFPEILYVYKLSSTFRSISIFNRNWYINCVYLKFLSQKISCFKNSLRKQGFENILIPLLILEIRMFYILEFLKIMNVKKLYLLLYVVQSFDLYFAMKNNESIEYLKLTGTDFDGIFELNNRDVIKKLRKVKFPENFI